MQNDPPNLKAAEGPRVREELDELRSILARCVKCGRCRGVCPVFREVQRETAVARGKLALLEAALLQFPRVDPALARSLSRCLLCGACTATCPNGARAHEAIQMARGLLAKERGLALPKRALALGSAVGRRHRDRLLRGASSLQKIIMTAIPEDRGLRFRVAWGPLGRAWVPELAMPFFLDRVSGEIESADGHSRVWLFVGCAIHYLVPRVGDATVGLLDRLGFAVTIPGGQGCCGLMARGMGEEDAARRMALHTMESFQDAGSDAIVVPCASCAAQLKHGYPPLFRASGSKLREAAEAFSARVHDLSEFLWAKGFSRLVAKGPEGRPRPAMTYHDPCHLAHGLGIRKEPRELLRALDRWSYREMAGADRCCGMGGSFRIFHPGISRGILGEKMRAIRDSGAQAVATGCMGCWIQLREGVATHHMPAGVFHLAEILWAELREADENTDRLLDGPSAV